MSERSPTLREAAPPLRSRRVELFGAHLDGGAPQNMARWGGKSTLYLEGQLGSSDDRGRFRLFFLDDARSTRSWSALGRAVDAAAPPAGVGVAEARPMRETSERGGLVGECWVSLPAARGRAGKDRADRLRALAESLLLQRVELSVSVRPVNFVNGAGTRVVGCALTAEGLLPAPTAAEGLLPAPSAAERGAPDTATELAPAGLNPST